jgi:hypothetical protein
MGGKPIIDLASQLEIAGAGSATLGPVDIGHATGMSLHGLSTGDDVSIVVHIFPHEIGDPNLGNIDTAEDAVVLADGVSQIIITDGMKATHGSISVVYTNGATPTVLDLALVLQRA